MARGEIPHFERFYRESTVFTTHVSDEPLNPWVQWPTIHAGVPYSEHGILHMGDGGLDLKQKCLAEVLSDAGVRVGVFGSMNLNYRRLNGYMIPDPWDKRGTAYPEYLNAFYRIVAQQVKDSSNYATSKRQLSSLGTFLLRNGLSAGTASAVVKQLWAERFDRGVRWQRAMLLDYISYDLFKTLNRRHHVQFATFFSNSTAHFQHYYWRDMEPQAFADTRPHDHPSVRTAILTGYRSMDWLLSRFMSDYPRATLIFCTGLSQGPRTMNDLYYSRVVDFAKFLQFMNWPPASHRILPCMSAEFHIVCDGVQEARAVYATLEGCTINGEPAFFVKLEEPKVVVSVRGSRDPKILERTLVHPNGSTIAFREVATMLEGSGSGTHRRDGAFWVRNGEHRVVEGEIELTDIAPTILSLFGVDAPAHMRGTARLERERSLQTA
jgi:hypothetical protein